MKSQREFADWNEQLATLERGISTRRDVERLLGAPDGSGHALLPTDESQLDLWYYADTAVFIVPEGLASQRTDMREQVLLVVFRGDVFDGFMWWSTEGSVRLD